MRHNIIQRLHLITQDDPRKSHQQMALEACDAGIKWIQLRMKYATEEKILTVAEEVRQICDRYHAFLIINDHVNIALEVDADGVHLGKNDMSPDKARAIVGPIKIIGGTANTFEDVKLLSRMEVDYIGVGPYRFTTTKKNLSPVLGLDGYHEIVERCAIENITVPLIAIGGIVSDDLPEIMKTGVHGVAVASAINYADNKQQEIEAFLNHLNYAKTEDS